MSVKPPKIEPTASERKREAERRRSERYPHVAEAWLWSPTATAEEERVEVTTLNLARHGVGFEVEAALPVGTFYMIEIGMGGQRIKSEIRIRTCRAGDGGLFEIGAVFC